MNRRTALCVAVPLLLLSTALGWAGDAALSVWKPVEGSPGTFRLDREALAGELAQAPREFTEAARDREVVVSLPRPDGTTARFRVEESPILTPAMTAKYGIRTYAARGIDEPADLARFDLGPHGFHALVLASSGPLVIRPEGDDPDRYVSEPYAEATFAGSVGCLTRESDLPTPLASSDGSEGTSSTGWSNDVLIYHLAAAASGEFTAANGGTKESALAAIVTIVNGVNAVYRRDVAIHFELVESNDLVIYTDAATDPYSSGDRECAAATCPLADCVLTQNQCTLDSVIGSENYDVGLVFDGAGGGRAQGGVCGDEKGRAASESTIGVAAHELGHKFGASHTYNDGMTGGCALERVASSAWEPGSGSTIMSYGGICAAANLVNTLDLDFHHGSATQIRQSAEDWGLSCAGHGLTANYPPVIQGMTGTVTVPVRTPFILDVDAYDPNEPTVTYSWEQFDLGTASPPEGDDGSRPLFRVYPPSTTSWRSFPSENYVYFNANEPPDTVGCGGFTCLSGESLPETTRVLHFRVMLRDGVDGVTIAETIVNTDAGSGPFEVTQPTGSTYWTEGTRKTVTWNPANTQNAPVSCQNVRILLSTDGGSTWPYVLASSTPNDGSEAVTLPFDTTPIARIKVEADGNVFYDVSESFTIEPLRVTNTNDSGRGSLRQAILDANDYPYGATIPLQIPGTGVRTITVNSQLPAALKPIALDSWEMGGPEYTGPPLLELVGTNCTSPVGQTTCDGLVLLGDNSFINGVVVRSFSGNGIVLRGAGAYANVIQNSYIGTDATGSVAQANGKSGVLIDGGYGNPAYGNLLWGNVISGNEVGVTITGAGADGNAMLRNKIGTNAAGTDRIPNLDDGVRIVGAPNTRIGEPGSGNVISGNGTVSNGFVNRYAEGIDVSGAEASGTIIQGNFIGLDATGSTGIYNTIGNIRIADAPNTLVGGTTAGARNVVGDDGTVNYTWAHCILVSGAGATGTVIQGNYLGTDATGTLDRGCRGAGVYADGTPGLRIGGTTPAERNVISGNNNYGGVYLINGAGGALIQGNYIGTDVTGSVAIPNNAIGVGVASGWNTIGGTVPGAGNVISGNAQRGIDLDEIGASNNVIQGNFIGTDASGIAAIPNGLYGINIERGENNLIGGTAPGARNVISGNVSTAVFISGSSGSMAPGNVVQGNYIGTDVTGTVPLGNGTGVNLYYVSEAMVGGSVPGAGNVISAGKAGSAGVSINSYGLATSGIVVQGNYIGTDVTGTAPLGNTGDGIWGSITGTASIVGNVIAGSGLNGITLGQGSFTVQGNFIGTDVTGTLDLRNTWSGIYSSSPAPCLIGGAGLGEGNVVAFSSPSNTGTNHAGVMVAGAAAGQTIRGNRIYSNTGLGIDLHWTGAFPNDHCDPDTGANGVQNFPVLIAANESGSSTHVTGTLDSTAGTTFTVDFYASPSCDAYGYGEGATYLGATSVTTDGGCNGSFDLVLPVPSSGVITATATDPSGNTSEFSACAAVAPSPVAEVEGVVWVSKNELTWNAATGATGYRVLRGEPQTLPDLLNVDYDSCTRSSGAALTTGPVLNEDPSWDGVPFYWYLVVGTNGTDDGPYGAGTAGPRIANESGACP